MYEVVPPVAATSDSSLPRRPQRSISSHLALTVKQPRLVLHVATVLTVVESITGELRVVPATFAFRE
jgi:hypothetical protein